MFWIVLITSFTQIDLHYNHKSTWWWLCNQGCQVRQILPTMWPQIPMFHWLNYNICPYMIKYISPYPIIHKNFYFFWKNFFWVITLAFNIINDVDNDNANYLRLEIANHLSLGSRLWFWSSFAFYSEAKSFIH